MLVHTVAHAAPGKTEGTPMTEPPPAPTYGPAILFCPGDRPERFSKALAAADQVILDLEDAIAPDAKERARREVASALPDLDLERVIVRVNPLGSPNGHRDLDALAGTGVEHVMAPKVERATDLEPADHAWVALCETPAGILAAQELAAAPGVAAIAWGSEDLAVSLQARVAPHLEPLRLPHLVVARGTVPLAAATAGVAALDRVFLSLDDEEGLRDEAIQAAAMGYRGKLAIHPRQVLAIRAAFLPSDDEIAHARELLAAAEEVGGQAFAFRGRMVDEPLIAQARTVLALASRRPR
jgi:citrate lyase subunit beta / citryl-CoA lyase